MFKGKVYLAGPMSGLPNHNFPAFHRAAKVLRSVGFEVVSPAELHAGEEVPREGQTWEEQYAAWCRFMRADLKVLMDCRGVFWLDGSGASKGASIEIHLANALGFDFIANISEKTIKSLIDMPQRVLDEAKVVTQKALMAEVEIETFGIKVTETNFEILQAAFSSTGAKDPYANIPKP